MGGNLTGMLADSTTSAPVMCSTTPIDWLFAKHLAKSNRSANVCTISPMAVFGADIALHFGNVGGFMLGGRFAKDFNLIRDLQLEALIDNRNVVSELFSFRSRDFIANVLRAENLLDKEIETIASKFFIQAIASTMINGPYYAYPKFLALEDIFLISSNDRNFRQVTNKISGEIFFITNNVTHDLWNRNTVRFATELPINYVGARCLGGFTDFTSSVKLSGVKLQVKIGNIASELDLDAFLGNDDGKFELGRGGNFSASAQHISLIQMRSDKARVAHTFLFCMLRTRKGSLIPTCLNLDCVIYVNDKKAIEFVGIYHVDEIFPENFALLKADGYFIHTVTHVRLESGHVLKARAQKIDSSFVDAEIDLDTCLGNWNGRFSLSAQAFSRSARQIVLEDGGRTLSCELRMLNGEWKFRRIDLDDFIMNVNGKLTFVGLNSKIPVINMPKHEGKFLATSCAVSLDLVSPGKTVLNAVCTDRNGKNVPCSITLDTHLGNKEGEFEVGGNNFSLTARNISLDEMRFLKCELKKTSGQWVYAMIDLNWLYVNDNGTLVLSPDHQTELHIIGATYGPADVTKKVESLVKNNSLTVQATNEVFTDPWYGFKKTLVVTYRFDGHEPNCEWVIEGATLTIKFDATKEKPTENLKIASAVYGLENVSHVVRSRVHQNSLSVVANDETFGDSWKGVTKILTVVYHNGAHYHTETAKEGKILSIEPRRAFGLNHSNVEQLKHFWELSCEYEFELALNLALSVRSHRYENAEESKVNDRLENWIGEIYNSIKQKTLFNLSIPGSHDSLTYGINKSSAASKDMPVKLEHIIFNGFDLVRNEIGAYWHTLNTEYARAQSLSVEDQLRCGIRYLDVRVCKYNDDFYSCDCFVSVRISDVLKQITAFLDKHPKEFVIFDLNHRYNFGNDDDFTVLWEKIMLPYEEYLLKTDKKLGDRTVESIVDPDKNGKGTKRRLIIAMSILPKSESCKAYIWNNSNNNQIKCEWFDKSDKEDILQALEASLIKAPPDKRDQMFVMQGIINESDDPDLYPKFVASGYFSAQDMSDDFNPALIKRLETTWKQHLPNIVVADRIDHQFVKAVVACNGVVGEKLFHLHPLAGVRSERKLLSASSDGSKLELSPEDDRSGRQRWALNKAGKEDDKYDIYEVTLLRGVPNDRNVLTASEDGSRVDVSVSDKSPKQRWVFIPHEYEPDVFLIRVLNLKDTKGKKWLSCANDGTKVDLWYEDDFSGRQNWKVIPAAHHNREEEEYKHEHHHHHDENGRKSLHILGATYGPVDVTSKVQGLVTEDSLTVVANNVNFTDNLVGHTKTLVVTYYYDGHEPNCKWVQERSTMEIKFDPKDEKPSPIRIINAVYGLANVTRDVEEKLKDNVLRVTANDATFGNTWRGNTKVLSVCYTDSPSRFHMETAKENEELVVESENKVFVTPLCRVCPTGGLNSTTTRKWLTSSDDGFKVDLSTDDLNSGRQQWELKNIGNEGRFNVYNLLLKKGFKDNRFVLSSSEDGQRLEMVKEDEGNGRQQWVFIPIEHERDVFLIRVARGVKNSRQWLSCSPDGGKVDLWYEDEESGRQRWRVA